MTKKVIFIGPAYPYRGGIAAFNENMASIFVENNWECKIFTFTQQYPNFLFPGKNQMATEDSAPNLNIKRGIYSTNPINWLKISKEIIEENPDLVIVQYWMPFMAPAFGTILRGVKKALPQSFCVTIAHNFKPHESRIGDKQLGVYLANRTDLLIGLSQEVSNDLKENIPEKPVIKLFHPIYDHYGNKMDQFTAKELLNWEKEKTYLLFFGLVRSYKGLDVLIDAIPHIDTEKNFELVIAGEFYENEKKYLKQISELGLSNKIKIINKYIANEDVPKYFCASELVVLPYKRATQSGVVPVAMHFEVPVVVTNVGGLAETIEKI